MMDYSQPGPSGVKRPRKAKKTFESKRPLTDEELQQYLMDSDDDIADPDFIGSESECDSDDSEDEEAEISTLDLDVTSDILEFVEPENTQIPTVIPPREMPADAVMWDATEYVPKQIPFTRQRELLVQPNGKL